MKFDRIAALGLVVAVAVSGCASGSGLHPIYCGLGGAVVGSGLGVVTQGEIHGYNSGSSTLGAGAAIGAVAGWLVGAGICLLLYTEEEKEAPKPEPPPPPPPKAEPPPPVKEKIVLRGVNFDFNKATIRPDAQVILDEAATILKRNPDVKVNVDGYTDSVGTDAYNQKLSERRAIAVVDYLGKAGVDKTHLTPRGFGEANPVASNDTSEGRAKNRRVELLVTN